MSTKSANDQPTAVASPSLAVVATNKIRDKILDLTLPPGMQLDESVLATRLGISRTPAREALNRLMTEGLVEARANRGFFVRSLNLGDTARFFDAYMIAERSVGLLCRFRHPAFVDDMEAIQSEHEAAIGEDRFLDVSHHNAIFHVRIATATENPHLIDFASRLHNLARRLVYLVYHYEADEYSHLRGQQQQIIEEHHKIIDAIRRARRAELVELLSTHADRFRARISRFIVGRPLSDFDAIFNPGDSTQTPRGSS